MYPEMSTKWLGINGPTLGVAHSVLDITSNAKISRTTNPGLGRQAVIVA
jgi:hypothetical protein